MKMSYKILEESIHDGQYKMLFEVTGMQFVISCIRIDKDRTDTIIFRTNENGNVGELNNYEPENTKFSREGLIEKIEEFIDLVTNGVIDPGFLKYQIPEERNFDIETEEVYNEDDLDLNKRYDRMTDNTILKSIQNLILHGFNFSKVSWARFYDAGGYCTTIFELKKGYSKEQYNDMLKFLERRNMLDDRGLFKIFGNIVFENGDYITADIVEGDNNYWRYITVPKY